MQYKAKRLLTLLAAVVLLPSMLIDKCRHKNYGMPVTIHNPINDKMECRIVCTDCGASAIFDMQQFKRVGEWEKLLPPNNKSEIRPPRRLCNGKQGVAYARTA